jgi:hypothetical protein
MKVQIKLSHRCFAMGNAEDYEVEVLAGERLVGAIRFEHMLVDEKDLRAGESDASVDHFEKLVTTARIGPDMAWFTASTQMLMAATTMFLMEEIERQCCEVIEDLFHSQEGEVIDWPSPPAWLLRAIESALSKIKEIA